MHQNPSSSVAGVSAPETVSGCIFVHDWNRSAFSACGKRPERAIAGVAPTRILRRAGEYRAGAAALHRALERLACQSNRKRHPQKSASICGFSYFGVTLRARGSTVGTLLAGPVFYRTPAPKDWMRVLHRLSNADPSMRDARNAYFGIPMVSHGRLKGVISLLSMFSEHLSESAGRLLISTADAEPVCVTFAKKFILDKCEER